MYQARIFFLHCIIMTLFLTLDVASLDMLSEFDFDQFSSSEGKPVLFFVMFGLLYFFFWGEVGHVLRPHHKVRAVLDKAYGVSHLFIPWLYFYII